MFMTKIRMFLFILLLAITAYSKAMTAAKSAEQKQNQCEMNLEKSFARGDQNHGR